MKLFHRRDPSAKSATPADAEELPVLPPKITIALNDEQKAMLESPVDPRVNRLIEKLNESKAAEQSRPRPMIGFGHDDEAKQVRADAETQAPLPDTL